MGGEPFGDELERDIALAEITFELAIQGIGAVIARLTGERPEPYAQAHVARVYFEQAVRRLGLAPPRPKARKD